MQLKYLTYSKFVSPWKFLPLRLLYLSGAQPLPALFPAVQEAGPWGFPPFPGQRGAGTLGGPPPPRSAHPPLPGGRGPGGRLPPPSPGKREPEPTRRASAAHRSTPAAGRARRLPSNSAGAGSHPGWRWPCPEPRKLGGVPGTRRAVPGKEPAREGSGSFGIRVEAGGQASPAGTLAVALPCSPLPFCPGGDGSAGGGGPSRPVRPSPPGPVLPADGYWRDPRSPARRYLRGHGARAASPTRERNSPARRAPSRSGRRRRGRGGCASGNIPAAHWPPPRPAPPRPRPQGHPRVPIGCGRADARWAGPFGRSRALTRGGRGAGAGRSSFVPNSAPRARAGPGGLRAAFPVAFLVRARPLCPGGGRSPAHLAGREAGGGSAEPGSAGPPGAGTGEPRVPRPRVLSQRRGSCGGGRARSENPPGKKIQRRWGGGGDGCRGLAAWDG